MEYKEAPRAFYNRGVDPPYISCFGNLTVAVGKRRFSVFSRRVSGLSCNVEILYEDRKGRQQRGGGVTNPALFITGVPPPPRVAVSRRHRATGLAVGRLSRRIGFPTWYMRGSFNEFC